GRGRVGSKSWVPRGEVGADRGDGIKVAAADGDEPSRRSKGRAHLDLGPSRTAVGRAVHEVGAIVSAAVPLVHPGDEDAAVAGAAGQLHIPDEAGAEKRRRRPRRAIVRPGDRETSTRDEVVKGDIHAAVERAVWVVVYPHGVAIVSEPCMGAGARGPRLAICGCPEANALAAAAADEIAGEPQTQFRVEQEDRITKVVAMAGGQWRRQNASECRAPVGGDGKA